MWLKLAGSVLVIAAGTGLGFQRAARYSERPRQIRRLIQCIVSLQACIHYACMPLAEALEHATTGVDGVIAELFHDMADRMRRQGWISPQEAMLQSLQEVRELALSQPETELLTVLGANLGHTNREEQRKYLEMVQQALGKIEQEAVQLRNQNVKMFRYLGVCGSLAVVILLL